MERLGLAAQTQLPFHAWEGSSTENCTTQQHAHLRAAQAMLPLPFRFHEDCELTRQNHCSWDPFLCQLSFSYAKASSLLGRKASSSAKGKNPSISKRTVQIIEQCQERKAGTKPHLSMRSMCSWCPIPEGQCTRTHSARLPAGLQHETKGTSRCPESLTKITVLQQKRLSSMNCVFPNMSSRKRIPLHCNKHKGLSHHFNFIQVKLHIV